MPNAAGLAQLSVGGVGFRELSANLQGGVAAARLGMRLAVEESQLFQVRFWWFSHLGGFTSQREFKGTLSSPLLFSTSVSQLLWRGHSFAATRCFDADSKGVEGAPALLEVLARCPLQDGRSGGGSHHREKKVHSVRGGLVTPGGLL